jgi:excisionase family DNA binding protein
MLPRTSQKLAYSIEEFAELASIGRTFIYEEINAKRLQARKVGRRTIILAEEARAYLESLPALQCATGNSVADEGNC